MSQITEVRDDDFAALVLEQSGPVLVDFWAPWCGPCKRLAPIVEQVAEQNADRLTVRSVDIDQATATAEKYGIVSVPTLAVFADGELVHRFPGRSRAALEAEIAPWL